jgi:hypothetical protein
VNVVHGGDGVEKQSPLLFLGCFVPWCVLERKTQDAVGSVKTWRMVSASISIGNVMSHTDFLRYAPKEPVASEFESRTSIEYQKGGLYALG